MLTVRPIALALAMLLVVVACGGAESSVGTGADGASSPAASGATIEPQASEVGGVGAGNTVPDACDGTLDAQTVEDVTVPSGATCVLEGTTVGGNVRVEADGTLRATGVTIDGDVQSQGSAAVEVDGATVGGNIQLEQGGSATVTASQIDGDVQWERQTGALVAEGNTIGGNLQAESNTGGLTVSDNTIEGNLQCESNDPAPTGGNNTVEGDKEGDCSGL